MKELRDLVGSALGAAGAWAVFELTGTAAWALLFLVVFVAGYLWLVRWAERRKEDGDD